MSNFAEVLILCEDRQQEVFVRHFLENCGIDRRRIRVKVCPKGKMSGEQFVRNSYPGEVRAHRSRASHLNIGLVVLTDADVRNVTEKHRELDEALSATGQSKRRPEERIAVFLPKRNVETWIHFLSGETVNEMDVYARLETESDCKPDVARLAKKPEYRLSDDVPGSLRDACSELRRIVPAKRCVAAPR